MLYVDEPNKKQKHPHYEQCVSKLDRKNNEFTSKRFQLIRKFSTRRTILESFKRIGMYLNDKTPASISNISDLDKVCFILINDYDSENRKLGVGPLNDGYLIGLNHHCHGYKVFYLYNSMSEYFLIFLEFLVKFTSQALTVFYSGRDDQLFEGIEFNDVTVSKSEISQILSKSCNGKARLIFITDSLQGSSVFDTKSCSNAVAFSVEKSSAFDSKENERKHGILTYYFCKMTSECPSITPNQMDNLMNPSLSRFNEVFKCELSDKKLGDTPIFVN